ARSWTQITEQHRITYGRVRRLIGNFGRVYGVNGADCCGFIGGDLGFDQIRNGDGGDDEDNRDDHEQFDQGKTLRLLALANIRWLAGVHIPPRSSSPPEQKLE